MWELDDDDVEVLKRVASDRGKRPLSGCLPENVIRSIIDPDVISDVVKPSVLRKQQKAVEAIQPLTAVVSSRLEPFIAHARRVVWTILNSGNADVRQARKAAVVWGWDEVLFLKVFEKLGAAPGPVTVRRGAPELPPMQPASYEGAWASKRKREIQVLCVAGPALDQWCSFQDFHATARRFYAGAGYKEVSAKLIVELAAVLTVDTKRSVGKQSKVTFFVSTMTVNSQLVCLSSPCRWSTHHPIDKGDAVRDHAIQFYHSMCDLSTIPSLTSEISHQVSSPPSEHHLNESHGPTIPSPPTHRMLFALSHDDD